MENGININLKIQLKNHNVTLITHTQKINKGGFFVNINMLSYIQSIKIGSILQTTIYLKFQRKINLLTEVSKIKPQKDDNYLIYLRFIGVNRYLTKYLANILTVESKKSIRPDLLNGKDSATQQSIYENSLLKHADIEHSIDLICKYHISEWTLLDYDTLQLFIQHISKWNQLICPHFDRVEKNRLMEIIIFFFKARNLNIFFKINQRTQKNLSINDYYSKMLIHANKYNHAIKKIDDYCHTSGNFLLKKITLELENECQKVYNEIRKKIEINSLKNIHQESGYRFLKQFQHPTFFVIPISLIFLIFSFGLSLKYDLPNEPRLSLQEINHLLPFYKIQVTNKMHFVLIKSSDWNKLINEEKKYKIGTLSKILSSKRIKNFVIIDENNDWKFRYYIDRSNIIANKTKAMKILY